LVSFAGLAFLFFLAVGRGCQTNGTSSMPCHRGEVFLLDIPRSCPLCVFRCLPLVDRVCYRPHAWLRLLSRPEIIQIKGCFPLRPPTKRMRFPADQPENGRTDWRSPRPNGTTSFRKRIVWYFDVYHRSVGNDHTERV
jgi:hypothetical protein